MGPRSHRPYCMLRAGAVSFSIHLHPSSRGSLFTFGGCPLSKVIQALQMAREAGDDPSTSIGGDCVGVHGECALDATGGALG